MFLWQCLAKSSCREAVAKRVAQCVAVKQKPCSYATGGYCVARTRLPENLFKGLARQVGRRLHKKALEAWLWKGRRVKVADGSTVSMRDTVKNQQAYLQGANQKAGVGFSIARILVIFSLAVGTAPELAICPCNGKGQSELAMFRQLLDTFEPGDVLLADRMHCTWFTVTALMARKVDFVVRLHSSRECDFRRGRRLGRDDHIVQWTKRRRPQWMSRGDYDALPACIEIREARLRVTISGFRGKTLVVATSLLDPDMHSRLELTGLYRQRWHAELNLKSLKVTLGMDVLRCETPEMVRKELWANLLSYNLIRSVMAQAAMTHGRVPRTLSFAASLQLLRAFQPKLQQATLHEVLHIATALLNAIVQHRVGHRPDRVEPRKRNRRPKPFPHLQQPRQEARKRLVRNPCG